MNVNELKPLADFVVANFHLEYEYTNDGYRFKGVQEFKKILRKLEDLSLVQHEVSAIQLTSFFKFATKDEYIVPFEEKGVIDSCFNRIFGIMLGIKRLGEFYAANENVPNDGSAIRVLLPPMESFQDLENISNDFKRAIDIQVTHPGIDGYVSIKGAEKGSIWLVVSLGTVLAAKLVGAIFWASAVIRKERAKAKLFEAHAKTLELKNEMLEDLVDAQKKQLGSILHAEAEAIAANHFNANDPEVTERLKLSINSATELIEKGTKIIPITEDAEIKQRFPDFAQLDFIESQIKQLKQG